MPDAADAHEFNQQFSHKLGKFINDVIEEAKKTGFSEKDAQCMVAYVCMQFSAGFMSMNGGSQNSFSEIASLSFANQSRGLPFQ